MTVGRSAGTTHPGRKRRRNEDAYVSDPPLFAVADGMGGAQAGALASRLAAGAIRDRDRSDGSATEERVTGLVQEANRRVHERATADEDARGMGTTMTLAVVEDDRVVFGHVGDSRAYRLRDGVFEQLTDDHSLVGELVRSGKLTPEEAETHPQRSVITRALGADPSVDVDTFAVETRPGDLFVICSDGLSSMIGSERIGEIARERRDDLDAMTQALVQAANDAGGEDNITVLCFEIGAAGADVPEHGGPTIVTGQDEEDEEDTLDELDEVPAASITMIRRAPALPDEPAATPGAEPEPAPDGAPSLREPAAPPRRRRSRLPLVLLFVVLALVLAVIAGLWGMSRAHFVGARSDGHVAVYQGVPWDLAGGVHLYRAVYVSPVLAGQLTLAERRGLFDHDLTSKSSAMERVRRLEQQLGT